MLKRVLIIGGYGNFGRFIAKRLALENDIQLIIAGRDIKKADVFCKQLNAYHPAQCINLDIQKSLAEVFAQVQPDIVIHTSGPFQTQSYAVANACIQQGCHYLDLADAREFVTNISQLNTTAKQKNLFICSGVSSVPCLTNTIVNYFEPAFAKMLSLDYAIATAQLTNLGLATTAAGLSYAGKPFTTLRNGKEKIVYGWQDLRARKFWGLGLRLLGNCDIPDLALFPARYPDLVDIRFQAGLELKFLHVMLWLLSFLVRFKICPNLHTLAPLLQKISRWFDVFGTHASGFYMQVTGLDKQGNAISKSFEIAAQAGDGLYIPCIPAIILCKKLVRNELKVRGAVPCIDLITLQEYLAELKDLRIQWRES